MICQNIVINELSMNTVTAVNELSMSTLTAVNELSMSTLTAVKELCADTRSVYAVHLQQSVLRLVKLMHTTVSEYTDCCE